MTKETVYLKENKEQAPEKFWSEEREGGNDVIKWSQKQKKFLKLKIKDSRNVWGVCSAHRGEAVQNYLWTDIINC